MLTPGKVNNQFVVVVAVVGVVVAVVGVAVVVVGVVVVVVVVAVVVVLLFMLFFATWQGSQAICCFCFCFSCFIVLIFF